MFPAASFTVVFISNYDPFYSFWLHKKKSNKVITERRQRDVKILKHRTATRYGLLSHWLGLTLRSTTCNQTSLNRFDFHSALQFSSNVIQHHGQRFSQKSSISHATNLHYDLSPRRVAVPCRLKCPENKSFSDHSGSNTDCADYTGNVFSFSYSLAHSLENAAPPAF